MTRTESIFGYLTTHQIAKILIGQDKAVVHIREQLDKLYLHDDTIDDIIEGINFNRNERLQNTMPSLGKLDADAKIIQSYLKELRGGESE